VNLAIVIDRSGSMKGSRIRNAIRAANAAVDRLHEGDTVSVVTFDTQVQVVVPPTAVAAGSRESINDAVRRIQLGGDTCISCGVEQAMTLLQQTSGKVNRMIVLSDGDANHGVRDLPGFRSMAQRARDKGVTITTIGVDVEYNEKVLAAIAQESNGHHYFVENDEALARVFEQEAEGLSSTVASDAEVTIQLPANVELDRVFDRSFRRAGDKVVVPLGSFAANDVKTVLMKVRLTGKRRDPGATPVASAEVSYKDLVTGKGARVAFNLAASIVSDAKEASEIDAVVASRVQRSETVQTLKEANVLFEQGKVGEAQRKLAAGEASLRNVAEKAKAAAPSPKRRAVAADLEEQKSALGAANSGFAQAPAAAPQAPFATPPGQAAPKPAAAQDSRAGKSAVRNNEQNATRLGF
jgi:Ca-activated chloride channel homolog